MDLKSTVLNLYHVGVNINFNRELYERELYKRYIELNLH